MPNNRIKEISNFHCAVSTYADMSTALGGETSDILDTVAYYDMENYDAILCIAIASNVVSTHVLTLSARQGTDTDGGGSTTISGASTTYTSTQATDIIVQCLEVDADMLTDGYDYVGFRASTDDADGTEAVALVVVPTLARYPQASPVA